MQNNLTNKTYYKLACEHLELQNRACMQENNPRYRFEHTNGYLFSPFGKIIPNVFYSKDLEEHELYKILSPFYEIGDIRNLKCIRNFFSKVDFLMAQEIENVHNLGLRSLWHLKLKAIEQKYNLA